MKKLKTNQENNYSPQPPRKKVKTIKKTIIHPSCLVPFVQVAEVGPLVPEFDICGLEKLRGAHLWFLDEKVVSFYAQLNIRLALGES